MAQIAGVDSRYDAARHAGSSADRHPHLLVCTDWCGVEYEGRGSAAARRRVVNPTPRERRQAAHHAVPSCVSRGVARLYRCCRSCRGPQGLAVRTSRGHGGTLLSEKPMGQPDAWRMIRRRAAVAGIAEEIGCHTFRATGITAYLANGGALEHAQEWPRMRARGRLSFTIGQKSDSPRTKSKESGCRSALAAAHDP